MAPISVKTVLMLFVALLTSFLTGPNVVGVHIRLVWDFISQGWPLTKYLLPSKGWLRRFRAPLAVTAFSVRFVLTFFLALFASFPMVTHVMGVHIRLLCRFISQSLCRWALNKLPTLLSKGSQPQNSTFLPLTCSKCDFSQIRFNIFCIPFH